MAKIFFFFSALLQTLGNFDADLNSHQPPIAIDGDLHRSSSVQFWVEERASWEQRRKDLLLTVHASGYTEYWQSAAIALAVMALTKGDLIEAEKFLMELPKLSGDPTVIWMELYLRRGEREQAVAALQKQLLHLVQQTQTCMVCFLDEKLELSWETSIEIIETLRQFESLLFRRTQLSDIMQVELFRRTGRTQEMVEHLCRYLDGLGEPSQTPNEILFPAAAIQTVHQETDKQLRQIIYLAVQQAYQSDEHRSDPKLYAALQKLKEIFPK